MRILKTKRLAASLLALGLFSNGALAHPQHALDDAAIFAIFDQANTVDIAAGKIGAQKGATDDVRNLGKMVATDHEAVRQMGRDLAKKLNILPKTLSDDNTGEYAQTLKALQAKSGADFDRAYLKHELTFHQSVIDAIKTNLLPAIKNPEFAELVRKVLPGFEHHLAATKSVAQKQGME